VSSFGVGGTNVHVIVEEYTQTPKESSSGRPFELLTWSAKSKESRDKYAERLSNFLQGQNETQLADLAYTLQISRADFKYRRFAIVKDEDELISKLDSTPAPSEVKTLKEKYDRLVFVFPGQGAQFNNMGLELYHSEPV